MKDELKTLFELKENDEEIIAGLPKENIGKHILIRVAILIVAVIGLVAVPILLNSEALTAFLYLGIFFPMIWFVFLIGEAIVLHFNKKKQLRNTNLILLLVLIPIFLIVFKSLA